MEFFNKKEEVIEIIMTHKGRQLFSSGKFNPTYYSFHDADITYEDNTNEEQNSIVPRIKETPTLKSISGISQDKIFFSPQKKFYSKDLEFNLKNEIGSKTYGDQYSPSWNLEFLSYPPFQYVGKDRDHISDYKHYEMPIVSNMDSEKSFQELIPQFNIQTLYEVADLNNNNENKYSIEFEIDTQNTLYGLFYFGVINSFADQGYIINANIPDDTFILKKVVDNAPVIINFSLSSLNKEIKGLYDNLIYKFIDILKEYFSLKIDSLDDLDKFLINGIKTEYIYNFQQINEIKKKFESLKFQINFQDINNNTFILFDENYNPIIFKFPVPKYMIKQTKWLIKDPNLVVSFDELNCFESNEFSEFEMEFYLIDEEKKEYKKLDNEKLKEYINIYFDNAANFIISDKNKNNYGDQQEADETLC